MKAATIYKVLHEHLADPETVWTVAEVAQLLKCSKPTVQALIHSGRLRAIRLGRIYRILRDDLRHFLTANPQYRGR